MNNYVFLNSKYKQFDGEKEYCNFSCNSHLKTNYLIIAITVLKYMSFC